jgi:hypothetical protein
LRAVRPPSRRIILPAVLGATLALPAPAAFAKATDKVSEPTVEAAVTAVAGAHAPRRERHHAHRRGGKVRLAWPRDTSERPPSFPLTRWMARQVGPDTTPAAARVATTNPSSLDFTGGISTSKLQLIRSFDIPPGDASHGRLNNLSWTYDNALAAIAFVDAGAKSQAEQLLDQLAALQTTDGALEFAYNVASGKGSGQIRSGALAWVGIAATYYRRTYTSTRYDALIAGVAKYLLALRQSDGLVQGGPDVSWVSTQHNLLTVAFLRDLVSSLATKPASGSLGLSSTTLNAAQNTMSNAILSKFIVQAGATAYFVEGLNDARIPLDVQSLGAMFLKQRGDGRAAQVAAYLLSNFYAAPRTSTALNTVLFGYRPFNAAASPDIVWSEGTIQADVALHRLEGLGVPTTYADLAVANLAGLTKGYTVAPPAADKDVATDTSWGEYHTWPASAPASWLVMLTAGGGNQLFTR